MSYGEILSGNIRGKILAYACNLPDVRSIVEVGTLDGTGSTSIIINALGSRADRDECSVFTVEANAEAHRLAARNLSGSQVALTLLFGNLLTEDSPLLLNGVSDTEAQWLASDRRFRFGAPNVEDQLPASIDLLVLDGGEFTTFSDYLTLRGKTKWLYLDDCNVRKNRLVLKTAVEDGFRVVQSSGDGNGVSLLRRWY